MDREDLPPKEGITDAEVKRRGENLVGDVPCPPGARNWFLPDHFSGTQLWELKSMGVVRAGMELIREWMWEESVLFKIGITFPFHNVWLKGFFHINFLVAMRYD